ncbi:MAG: YbaN family protein [Desulfuromonadales bacterium]|nr:YbaN family protein [Desulfuromonadales bacterium]
MLRAVLFTIGLLSTALGLLGIFLPLLPTVPFLLLAAACFARSSEHVHRWLLGHRRLGPLLRDYQDGAGIPLRAKVMAISLIWVSIPLSAWTVVPLAWVRIGLLLLAVGVTLYLLRLPTRP